MADVFISYKREDRARIAPIARVLEERGYTVWWDLELVAGQKWARKIKAELDAAKCVIVAWTKARNQTYISE
ncbi:MAG: toll/interleukin-1 receptor domain-containing protein [Terricaulis sp.]